MEQSTTMDKKLHSRPSLCKNNQDPSKFGFDYSTKKNGSQYPRKRESEKYDNGKRSSTNRGGRAGQRYVRPREKVDCQVDAQESSEIGSLQRSGSKKQNITHLLNWWGPGPERHSNRVLGGQHSNTRGYRGRMHVSHAKYNKEHYLQANCQFVVSNGHDYSESENDPDHLVDWNCVEEVRLHVSESPSCPICLYPPVAAKISRCGHIFCFPCVLHYFALTDDKWRKCPICYDAVTKEDLKSVVVILHKEFRVNEEIELTLMRRERDSLIPVPVTRYSPNLSKGLAFILDSDVVLPYSKLIVASMAEVAKIVVGREIQGLKCQLALEGDQPEACFIQEALALVSAREALLKSQSRSLPVMSEEASSLESLGASLKGLYLYASNLENIQGDGRDHDPLWGIPAERMTSAFSDNATKITEEDSKKELNFEIVENCQINQQESRGAPKSTFYFYQESSGAHVYLHALNVHMLVKEFGSLENCPAKIKAKVVEKESESMNESIRQRLRYLRHLPITCPFEVVEVEVKPPLVSLLTVAEFQGQLDQRERKRKKRAKEEHRIEKRAQIEEDRLMGRSRGAKINMTSLKHFPTFTEDQPSLVTAEEEIYSSPSVGSFSEEHPEPSTLSFAQMIRCGQKKQSSPEESFPSLGSSSSYTLRQPSASLTIKGSSKTMNVTNSDDEESERVPDFSTAFSDAFARALDQAERKISESATSDDKSPRGKKGKKKKKGIILLSSGGR